MTKFRGVPQGALALPSLRKEATPGKSAEPKKQQKAVADLLQLGRGKRKVSARGKNGLRPWGGEWTVEQLGGIFRRDKWFADFVLLSLFDVASKVNSSGIKKDPEKLTAREIRSLVIDTIRDPKRTVSMAAAAENVLVTLADVSNRSKTHPIDVAHLMLNAIGSKEAARRDSTMVIVRGLSDQRTSDNIRAALTLKASANRIAAVGHGLFITAARVIRQFASGAFSGFASANGLKPWKKQAGQTMGVEVVSFSFAMPTFNEAERNGANVATHTLASQDIEKMAANTAELKGGLAKTPAGRVFLCSGLDGKGLFLASERKPQRRLFLAYEESPTDAAIQDHQVRSNITGFVI